MKQSKVLIIDDEPIVHHTMEALLASQGYELVFASNGDDGIAIAREILPDVILLDVMMPGMDGFEACKILKGDELTRYIPTIMITALRDKETLEGSLDSGADEFITKPVLGGELRARIRSMLRIKKQYDDLQELMRLREELVHMIIHDMRSPLNVIMGYTDMLKKANDIPATHRRRAEKVYEQSLHLNAFLTELLMAAKMEQGKLALNLGAVNVNNLIQEVVGSHHPIAELQNIELVVDLPEQANTIIADGQLLTRVIDNLLSNALKYSPTESQVVIQANYPPYNGNSHVRIQITDQGPGIPVEYRTEIFNKYKIVDLKKQGLAQIGLGLAFCKLVIEAHGGKIWVEDGASLGSSFIFEL